MTSPPVNKNPSLQALSQEFIALSYQQAGINPHDWQPEKGYRYNKELLHQLYYYYQQLYQRCPDKFLWAGLARLTGGQVLYGMNNLSRIARDPCGLTVNIVGVARAIFENLGWQHELFLHDPQLLLQACHQLDQQHQAPYAFTACWETILSDSPNGASEGNKMLLKNEQFDTIQPYYQNIKADRYSARYFWFTRFVMRNIHPHHKRFILCYPLKDVTRFPDRWQWIEGPRGMWQTWINCGQAERDRLVALPNEAVIAHQWK